MKSTPDLCDQYSDQINIINKQWINFGKRESFFGKVVTLSCFEDNSKVREILSTNGEEKVLFIDGNNSMNRALLGDQLALLALENSWAGIIVLGPIRDCEIIRKLNIGVKALGTNPMKTKKENKGDLNVPLLIDNINISPGDWIYADLNGVIVAKSKLF